MSNILGKTMLEMKRVGKVISRSACEVGNAIGEAATNISAHTKKVAKISMMKAEIDNLYYELGKAVFEDGLMPSNELAMTYMDELFEKVDVLEALENELKSDEDTCSCGDECTCVEGECSCGDECACHQEEVEDISADETPVEDVSETTDEAEKSE